MRTNDIKIEQYNYDTKETEVLHEGISPYTLGKSINTEQLGDILEGFCNSYSAGVGQGQETGRYLHRKHHTLQRLLVGFLLGALAGLGEYKYTDARNEKAIATARKIKAMLEDGDLPIGMLI